jgi:hypothetical protein
MKKVKWQEIAAPAQQIFNIWVEHPELKWAELAWKALDEQSLTRYSNQLEKQQVLVNLLALGFIYHEFCQLAFDETSHFDEQISNLLESFEDNDLYISSYFMGVILKSESNLYQLELTSIECEREILPSLLSTAAQKSVGKVAKALALGCGSGDELFISLWNSNKSEDSHIISTLNELNFLEVAPAYEFVKSFPLRE